MYEYWRVNIYVIYIVISSQEKAAQGFVEEHLHIFASEWNVPSFHIDQWFSQFDKRFGLSVQHLFDYHSRLKTIE